MSQRVGVLLLEDDPLDAALVTRTLAQQLPDAAVEHAWTREQYLDRLASRAFDVVLSDGSVAGCEGLKAFHLARERHPHVPFICLSGFDDPDRDLHGLKALGISDFLLKSDLRQLGARVQRALRARKQISSNAARLLAGYERLVNVVKELSLARDLAAIMAIVRRAARELTGADGATFVLRDGELCHYADEDAIGPLWKGQKFPMHSCISGWAMMHRQPAVVQDIYADPRIPVAAYEPTFVRSVVMVPIRAIEPIGAIGSYWATSRLPDPREVRLLQALADTTAVAMENVRIHGSLETRVRERTAELEAFTYAVSHDLRAPVRHVHGFASMILEDYQAQLDDEFRRKTGNIAAAAVHMGRMIDGLLELSRMTQAQIVRQPVDLAGLARAVAEECRQNGRYDVEFTAPPALEAAGDPTLLRVALQNLLGNAWKYSSKGEAPRVELGVQLDAAAQPTYFVRDNGAGFEPAAAARLFGVFQRLHTQEEFPGTGVGLATVKRIIRKHGGRIWATGAPGKGATFFFTLGDESGESGW